MKWSTLVACFACFSTDVEQCKTCPRWFCKIHMARHLKNVCDEFKIEKGGKYHES